MNVKTRYWRIIHDAAVPRLLRGQFVYSAPGEKYLRLPGRVEDYNVLVPNLWTENLGPDEEAAARFLTDLGTDEEVAKKATGTDLGEAIRHLAELRSDFDSAWLALTNRIKLMTGKDVLFEDLSWASTEEGQLNALFLKVWDNKTKHLLGDLEDMAEKVAAATAALIGKE